MSNAPSRTGHADPRVPAREVCVVRYLLDRWAVERGDQVYVIFDDGFSLTYRQIRERVIARLPPYMHPSALHLVTDWPLNANGKVDRAALRAVVDAEALATAPQRPGASASTGTEGVA